MHMAPQLEGGMGMGGMGGMADMMGGMGGVSTYDHEYFVSY